MQHCRAYELHFLTEQLLLLPGHSAGSSQSPNKTLNERKTARECRAVCEMLAQLRGALLHRDGLILLPLDPGVQ